ncbi:MAG: hypothetical protein N2117_12270 [Anaerolineales bacterium]|nr:hypothetical protein [Anaerolineales bacterium]MCX7755999.1 hypothetical protein [Anaerolineales bacterium]MDW8277007.1 hypothetical protein [Anaerolineales bacterium]
MNVTLKPESCHEFRTRLGEFVRGQVYHLPHVPQIGALREQVFDLLNLW